MFYQSLLDNLGSIILAIILVYLIWKVYKMPKNLPPGPTPWPLIGNLTYFQHTNELYIDYQRLSKEYGDIASVYYGRRLLIILNTYKIIKEAFINRNLDFNDREPAFLGSDYIYMRDEIFNNQFNKDWQWKRKFALKALKNTGFGTKAVENKVIKEVNELLNWIDEQNGRAFDIGCALENLHANVIFNILISKTKPWFSEEIQDMLSASTEFYSVIKNCTTATLELAPQYLPMWLVRIIFKKMLDAHVNDGFKHSRSIIKAAIEEKRKEGIDKENQRDFLDAYLVERDDCDELELIHNVGILIPDSVETVSSLELWTLLYLTYNPDIQAKCQMQLDEVCGTRAPVLNDRSELHYVEASILEALRLGAPTPISMAHIAAKDTELEGYTVPRTNTCVIANFFAVHRDPEIFPDPEKFNPERFIDENGHFHRAETVLSFGTGKRMCIGKPMAEIQGFLVISSILQRYTLSFPPDQLNPTTQAEPGNMFRRPYPFKIIVSPR